MVRDWCLFVWCPTSVCSQYWRTPPCNPPPSLQDWGLHWSLLVISVPMAIDAIFAMHLLKRRSTWATSSPWLGIAIKDHDIMEPQWKAYNILRKMDYLYKHIVHSMKNPNIATFWLLTLPQIVGGFDYDMWSRKFGGNTRNLCGMISFEKWWRSKTCGKF